MPTVVVPNNVTSITVTGEGVLTPSAGKITVASASIATQLVQDIFWPKIQTTDLANGNLTLFLCPLITSITAGAVTAVTAGVSAAISGANATPLLQQGFRYGGP